jgi:antitoxin component HigA of HigAB toxin-antitoxin module
MNKRYKEFGYEITTDPEFMDEQNAMTPELRIKFEPLYNEIEDERCSKKTIDKILKLIEKHPENPQLKNYLSIAYKTSGNDVKAYEVNRWIHAEHPDYLFGKLNEAAQYYENEEYEKMAEELGLMMEIQDLYPDRKIFHLLEVIAFNRFAIMYFTATGKQEAAESRYKILEQIAPGHPDTIQALGYLLPGRWKESQKMWEEEKKTKFHVTPVSNIRPQQITAPPVFVNPVINQLYENGLYIDLVLIHEILSLPRQSLITDLEQILNDMLCRYEFFREDVDDNGWDEEQMSFPIHAVLLLGELRAENSLPKVLEVLSQDYDFLHFWFGDHITSTLWEPLYYLGNKQLDVFKKFIQEPGINTYAKTATSDAVSQIPYYQPERNDEVLMWFSEVLEFFANSPPEDNVIDSDAIGLILCDVLDLKYDVLLPKIKELFNKHYVPESITGDYKTVQKDIKKPSLYPKQKDLLNIGDRYERITTTWAGYTEEEDDDDDDKMLYDDYEDKMLYDDYEDIPEILPVRKEQKIGRNDPCPCGSGKKYKKCCLNKNIY